MPPRISWTNFVSTFRSRAITRLLDGFPEDVFPRRRAGSAEIESSGAPTGQSPLQDTDNRDSAISSFTSSKLVPPPT
jgi:hypothetical protein